MEKSMMIAIVAVAISIVSISSSIALRPATLAPEVTTDELADGAVTGDKIASGTITDANLTPAGISRVASGAVGTDQIADNAITAEKIAENAIPEFVIGDNEITSAMIKDETITNVDISSTAAINGAKLANDSITATQIATNAVGSSELASNAVTSAKIEDGSIRTSDIAENALTWWYQVGHRVGDPRMALEDGDEVFTYDLTLAEASLVLVVFSGKFYYENVADWIEVEISVDYGLIIEGYSAHSISERSHWCENAGMSYSIGTSWMGYLQEGGHNIRVLFSGCYNHDVVFMSCGAMQVIVFKR
jgi:hypothetical protein